MKIKKRSVSMWPIGLAAVFVLSCALYFPMLRGALVWDDDDLVAGKAFGSSSFVSAFTHPFLGHYFRPLTSLSFVVENSLHHKLPIFYHQTNIIFHALTAVLLSCLVFLITKRQAAGLLTGAFFATQPLQVGATAWIGGRTDVMSAMFISAFMVALVLYHQTSKAKWLIASAIAYLLAGLSKEQAMAIVFAVPLSVFVFGSGKWKDALRICIPFAVVIAAFIGLWCLNAPAPYTGRNTIPYAVTLALRTAAHYGLAWLAPNKRSILTFTLENYQGFQWVLAGLAIVTGFAFFLRTCWKRCKPVAWVAVCGLLVYMPISNFPPVAAFVIGPYRCSESGTAVACLFGIVCAYAYRNRNYLLALATSANLVAGAVVTSIGMQYWMAPLPFFDAVAHNDTHFMLGVGNFAHQLDVYDRPKEVVLWTDAYLTWLFGTPNWRAVLNTKKTAAFTKDVVARQKSNGGLPDTRGLGWFIGCNAGALVRLHRQNEAILSERALLVVVPHDAHSNFVYGQMVLKTDRQDAIRHWELALKDVPKFAACAIALAHERLADGRPAVADKLLEPAMATGKWESSAWVDLARARIGVHNYPGARQALAHAETARCAKPDEIAALKKRVREFPQPPAWAG